MSQNHFAVSQNAEFRINIINLLHQYAKNGTYNILSQTGDPVTEEKYNFIIMRFEALKENKYAEAVERMVGHTTWKEEYSTEIKAIFSTKRAQCIIHQLKANLKNTAAMEQIMTTLRPYLYSSNNRGSPMVEAAPAEIATIINRIYTYKQALRLVAEYPSTANIARLDKIIKQKYAELGSIQAFDLKNICTLKNCFLFLDEKLKKFQGNYIRGPIDEQLADRIRVPLQKLLRDHQHASDSLNRFNINSVKNTNDGFKIEEITDKMSNLNKQAQEILRKCDFPFDQCSRGVEMQNKIANLSAKIDSMGQMFQHYNEFVQNIEKISVRNGVPQKRFNYQVYPYQKPVLAKRLENILELLKAQSQGKLNEVKRQNESKKQKIKITYIPANQTNTLQQISSHTKDLQERTVLLNRWQTIWQQVGFGDKFQINLDRNHYPKKGQKDLPLQAICAQIATLQKQHHYYLQALENNKGLPKEMKRQMTEDEQFLASNPNIKEEFYRDKETIKNMNLNQIIFTGKLSRQDSQLESLRASQKQMGWLLDQIQVKVNKITNIQSSVIRDTRQEYLMSALEYIEQIFNQKMDKIRQIQDENSRINNQLLKLRRQVDNMTRQKTIAEHQVKNMIAFNRKKQEENAQLSSKAANRSENQQLRQALLIQMESLNQEYQSKIEELEQANRQLHLKDNRIAELSQQIEQAEKNRLSLQSQKNQQFNLQNGKIQQLRTQKQLLEKNLSQAKKYMEFTTEINIDDLAKISFQQFQEKAQLIVNHYTGLIAHLEETIKQKVIRYISSQNSLESLRKYVQKMRRDRRTDEKTIQYLKQQLFEQKRKSQSLQSDLKTSSSRAGQDQQIIIKNQTEIKKFKNVVQELNGEIKKQKSVIADLQIDLQASQSGKINLQIEIEGLKMQLSMIDGPSPAPSNTNHQEIEKKQKRLEAEINNLKDQLKQKTKDLSQTNSKLSQSQDEIRRYESKNETFKSELKKKNEMIEHFKVTSSANNANQNVRSNPNKKIEQAQLKQTIYKQISFKFQSQFLARKQRLMKMYATKYSNVAKQNNSSELREVYLACIDNFFQGELLHQEIGLKYRLACHLETFTSMPILRTKPIYTFDLKSKTNFHLYIDGVSSLLFIVKTVTGLFLAGYYSGKYLEGPMMDSGLLISISKNQSYRLNVPDHNSKNSYRCMVYDPYFIIFGNAEIRIKTGQKVLFSNFGIMNSYFNTYNKKLKDFIGFEDKREVEIESYEIYEVLFNYEFYDD